LVTSDPSRLQRFSWKSGQPDPRDAAAFSPPLEGAAFMQFLYMGFTQNANVRSFRFQGVVARERPSKVAQNIEFLLTADMALLAQHRIRVQDGPTLCLKILTTAFAGEEDRALEFSTYVITREDVSLFASARNAVEDAKVARRKHRPPFKPSASSQLKWPQVK
jgi:hypothetical protein